MEGSEFHRSVNRAEKKLISGSILFDEYLTLYDKMFHIHSGNVLDDIGTKLGWTLFILLKGMCASTLQIFVFSIR